jgi:menaquinone-dependent protoporphyrinogen oxidase
LRPLDVGSFAGWNLPERFSLGERMMLKMTGAPKGDFRDWPAIEAWATALAGPLGLPG